MSEKYGYYYSLFFNMTMKQLKETNEYKDLKYRGKSKLRKIKLCEIMANYYSKHSTSNDYPNFSKKHNKEMPYGNPPKIKKSKKLKSEITKKLKSEITKKIIMCSNKKEVKKIYKKLMLEYHPDRHMENKEYYEEVTKIINIIYETELQNRIN
jgi:hypothetical protein